MLFNSIEYMSFLPTVFAIYPRYNIDKTASLHHKHGTHTELETPRSIGQTGGASSEKRH